ncbi:MAG: DUF4249 family protein, partial [Allomuricauda sp.]
MKLRRKYPFVLISVTLMLFIGCIEEFEPKINDFEDFLVVEATISNEMKHQIIYLDRTYRFEDETDSLGTSASKIGAQVRVLDNIGNEYVFNETEPGVYTSTAPFKAESNVNYQLKITTDDG